MLMFIKVTIGIMIYLGVVLLIARFISVCAGEDKCDEPENMQVEIKKECSNCCYYDETVKLCKIHNSNKLCKDYKYI